MDKLIINSVLSSFPVFFMDSFSFLDDLIANGNYIVIVGEVVYQLYKNEIFDKFEPENIVIVKLDEKRKTLQTVELIYHELLKRTAKKNITLISFGGGINQDVIGFVASTMYRGINWIYVPTTLLSMADSSIGLKTSLNFGDYKNIIGTFYPPTAVYINPRFLDTLEEKDYFSGIGEIVKLLLMESGSLNKIEEIYNKVSILKMRKDKKKIMEIVRDALIIKLSYMENDEFDQGRRNLLNYGHEFGHALESTSDFAIPHGIAVIIGIIFANLVSVNRGLMDKKVCKLIIEKLLLPNIPSKISLLKKEYFKSSIVVDRLKKDKKRTSENLVLVLPDKDFSLIKVQNLTVPEVEKNLEELRKILL